MFDFDWEWVCGLQLGMEHIDASREDVGIDWMIVLNLLVIRLHLTKIREE